MKHKLSASLIITSYNWPEAIRVTLRSVLSQSVRPTQVVVADDGSGAEFAKAVKEVLGTSDLRWRHVWHQDKGVRQSRIKNLAVKHADQPYLIFIDQDVILHPEFVGDHLSIAEKGMFLQGKRVLLPDHYSEKVLAEGELPPVNHWMPGLGNRKNTFRVPPLGRLLARPKKFQISLRGCNLSMFFDDYVKVDGFDEAFDRSWGREDSDICYRLFHRNVRIKNLWFLALQYHLKHEIPSRWERVRLNKELQRNLQEKRVRALQGLSQLSSEGEIIGASENL